MSKLAIKAENISKQYRLGEVGTGTLSHDLNRFWHKVRGKEDPYLQIGQANDRSQKADSNYVWSLKDINFEIEQGDAVGIIGRNGAGKSTLLKLLSKVTKPTTGKFHVNGRIASLLEVGTGFNPEMTGRENIYMNGAILGMRRHEITRKFDEIVDFSGVEAYIDTPVKRYSSGMYVRLAFAVAAHLESEILIVDEVLAVGDAEFQKKCLGKMGDVSKGEGRTVLFVSHNLASVKTLCNNSILLSNGQIKMIGAVDDIISQYFIQNNTENAEWIRSSIINSEIYFNHIKITNSTGQNTNRLSNIESFKIHISFTSLIKSNSATISIRFENSEGIPVFTTNLHDHFIDDVNINKGTHEIDVLFSNNIFIAGNYKLVIACFISRVKLFDCIEDLNITVEDLLGKTKDKDRQGIVQPIYEWIIKSN
jgi:lipopolysaccharide transport system ATP-binding protein